MSEWWVYDYLTMMAIVGSVSSFASLGVGLLAGRFWNRT
jgi:hypothetical protein